MLRHGKSWMVVLSVVFLLLAGLACSGSTDEGAPSITIISPVSGATVTVGQEVQIVSTAAAKAGVARVDLSVNGQVVRADAPPSGNPTTFSVSQPWTPAAEGDVTISVVAYDAKGAVSEPATVTLHVGTGAADSGGAAPVPEATQTPVPDVTGEGGCTLNVSYVADVTVPDDTEFAPGTAFVKTWRIRNSGTCDWTAGFNLVFVSGDQMGGEATVAVPPTAAGSTADLSVHLTAPSSPGTYRGNWRVQSDEGLAFGSIVYVQIVVAGAATEEPTEEPTGEPAGPTNLVATGRADGSMRFTWNDAVGEAEYRYDFEIRRGTSGDRDTGILPADTISWTSDDYPCGAEGDFTLQALAGDGGEIGEASVHFETLACGPDLVVSQWAIAADASSHWGSTDGWSAMQATGEPDTDECGDYETAWASSSSTGVDWLELFYATLVIPTQINIYETHSPGFIVEVEVIDEDDFYYTVWQGDPAPVDECPRIFSVAVTGIDFPVVGVRINLDQSDGGSWNEIDAVELVGIE